MPRCHSRCSSTYQHLFPDCRRCSRDMSPTIVLLTNLPTLNLLFGEQTNVMITRGSHVFALRIGAALSSPCRRHSSPCRLIPFPRDLSKFRLFSTLSDELTPSLIATNLSCRFLYRSSLFYSSNILPANTGTFMAKRGCGERGVALTRTFHSEHTPPPSPPPPL